MTYWGYHLLFTLPLLVALWWFARSSLTRGAWLSMATVLLIVMVFTTPWDNYAVYLGIWGFGENVSLGYPFAFVAEESAVLGHIPFEEYSYFIIESVLACFLTLIIIRRIKAKST